MAFCRAHGDLYLRTSEMQNAITIAAEAYSQAVHLGPRYAMRRAFVIGLLEMSKTVAPEDRASIERLAEALDWTDG